MRDWRTRPEVPEKRAAMHANAFRVLPAVEADKAPMFADWPNYVLPLAPPESPIPRTRNREGNPTRLLHLGTSALTTGIIGVDIDIDDSAKAHAARVAFEMAAGERAVCVRYRDNAARRLLIYRAGPDVSGISASFGDKPVMVEVFANHGGRQVYLYGRHPSGASLLWEGDGPADIPVADLPRLDRAILQRATLAALEAAGIKTGANGGAPTSKRRQVRKQTTMGGVVDGIATALHEIATGSSVHNASNALADLLVFQLGLDDEQAAALLAAVAGMSMRLTPAEAERYAELLGKAASRASWYAERAENPPEADPDGVVDPTKLGYWRTARERQMTRAWSLLPADMRAEFVRALLQHQSEQGAAHGL